MQAAVLERLRAAGLRPTRARIGVYQAIAALGAEGFTVPAVFHATAGSGCRASISSIYRIMREFSQHGLVSTTLAGDRTAVYFVTTGASTQGVICLECGKTGRLIAIEDPQLHARLAALAAEQGMALGEVPILVRF